jgi:hypothetical protein
VLPNSAHLASHASIVPLGGCLLRPVILRDFFQQRLGSFRRSHRDINYLPAIGTLAIHRVISALVGLDDSTIQADTGEHCCENKVKISAFILVSVSAAACRPTGPAAAVASAPILNLSLSRLCMPLSFMYPLHILFGRTLVDR